MAANISDWSNNHTSHIHVQMYTEVNKTRNEWTDELKGALSLCKLQCSEAYSSQIAKKEIVQENTAKIPTRRRSRGTNRTIHQQTSDFCHPNNKYGDHRFPSQNINFDSK